MEVTYVLASDDMNFPFATVLPRSIMDAIMASTSGWLGENGENMTGAPAIAQNVSRKCNKNKCNETNYDRLSTERPGFQIYIDILSKEYTCEAVQDCIRQLINQHVICQHEKLHHVKPDLYVGKVLGRKRVKGFAMYVEYVVGVSKEYEAFHHPVKNHTRTM